MIPDFATHYHLPDREPFLTLSELEGNVQHPAFVELLNKHKTDPRYRRRYGAKYLEMRRDTEIKLRRLFEKRGGRPRRRFPLYFILGTSTWFRDLNDDHKEIRIRLSELPQEATSVTFPDSYIAMSREDKLYYEKVYFLGELQEVVDRYGLPMDETSKTYERYWMGEFEKYIEIQVWDDSVVEPYRRNWRSSLDGSDRFGKTVRVAESDAGPNGTG